MKSPKSLWALGRPARGSGYEEREAGVSEDDSEKGRRAEEAVVGGSASTLFP